jgi:cell division protein FtsW (lipid II flippase)
MDEDNKKKFQMKFYFLALQLNAIILFFTLAVIMFFIGPGQFRIPLILVMILIALVLSLNFKKKYNETKLWLDEHGGKDKDT